MLNTVIGAECVANMILGLVQAYEARCNSWLLLDQAERRATRPTLGGRARKAADLLLRPDSRSIFFASARSCS